MKTDPAYIVQQAAHEALWVSMVEDCGSGFLVHKTNNVLDPIGDTTSSLQNTNPSAFVIGNSELSSGTGATAGENHDITTS